MRVADGYYNVVVLPAGDAEYCAAHPEALVRYEAYLTSEHSEHLLPCCSDLGAQIGVIVVGCQGIAPRLYRRGYRQPSRAHVRGLFSCEWDRRGTLRWPLEASGSKFSLHRCRASQHGRAW